MENDKLEPIAIIGINLKFPGDATSAEGFWNMLCEKRCSVSKVPEDRFNVNAFYHPDPARSDSLKVLNGHFIKEDLKAFDAPFFTMSPAEASILDPQQRGLLEGAYHTFENAGIPITDLAGSNTSVFVASFGRDMEAFLLRDPEYQFKYQATSSGSTMLSNRISHFFDLRGPSLSVDTACSSGLYAFHLACQSLLQGESEMSLVAGSNTYATPECMSIPLCNGGFLSVDGISYSFDHRANGYARGEGFGFALLKPLRHALRDGDLIRGVVRATGANQDGRTPSITQPSTNAQIALMQKTYNAGGLDLATTRYVEAHGTGTIVGDPIEATAIGEVFREHRDTSHPLYVGSVKSNIGHLEGASGLAGLLKIVLMLERAVIPPNAWTEKTNEAIDTDHLRIQFPAETIQWPTTGLRRASVSSFGYGGSNAHVVMDDACNYLKSRGLEGFHQSKDLSKYDGNGVVNGGVNGHHNGGINGHYNGGTNGHHNGGINGHHNGGTNGHHNGGINGHHNGGTNGHHNGGINGHHNGGINGHHNGGINGHYNGGTNGHHNGGINGHRNGYSHVTSEVALNGSGAESPTGLLLFSAADEDGPMRQASALQDHLASLSDKKRTSKYFSDLLHTLSSRRTHFPWRSFAVSSSASQAAEELCGKLSPSIRTSQSTEMHLVFTGQGAQWAQMGVELLQYPVFGQSLEDCELYLKSIGCPWVLRDELQRPVDSTQIHRPAFSQPICTAIQVALVELFRSWGISPSSVCGHSSGEIAAAFCAGALTRQSAWKVAYYRGVVADKLVATCKVPTTMMSVGLGEDAITPYLDEISQFVSLGCVNSPINVTLTGTTQLIDQLWEIFDKKEIFARKLAVDIAYHSKFMLAVAEEYQALIADIEGPPTAPEGGKPKRVAIYSSVTGTAITNEELCEPSYWVKNLTSTVRFCDAVTAMVKGGDRNPRAYKQAFHVLVEIGPQAALRRPVQDTLAGLLRKDQWVFSAALKANYNGTQSALETSGLLWTCGVNVNIDALNTASVTESRKPTLLTDLPSYPFSRATTYWTESRLSRNYGFRPYRRHQLLGLRAKDWNQGEASWRHFIRSQENPWVLDHGLNGSPLYPGSGMIAMAIEAARQLSDHQEHEITGYRLKNLRFLRAINIDTSEHGTEAQIHLRPRRLASNSSAQTWYDWRIYCLSGEEWTEAAYGSIKVELALGKDNPAVADARNTRVLESLQQNYQQAADQCSLSVHHDQLYDNLAKYGFSYGPYFRQLRTVRYNRMGFASATVPLRGYAEGMPYAAEDPCVIHPTTLDAICHLQMVALSAGGWKPMPTMIFSHLRELWVSQKLLTAVGNPQLSASTHETMRGFREVEFDTVVLLADSREPVLTIEGERGTAITSLALAAETGAQGSEGMIYELDFRPDFSLLNMEEARNVLMPRFKEFESPVKEYIDRADAIAAYHVERVLKLLDRNALPQDRSHIKRYLSWMERVANERSKFTLESRGHANLDIRDVLREAHSEPSQRLIAAAGENLYEIITGQTDPLQILFEAGLADDFYHSVMFSANYKKMGVYLDYLAHQNPTLKLLEVGAGTGSATEQILPFLSYDGGNGQISYRFSEYDYTDISPGFFERARERFNKHANYMRFQKLDLELDPVSQGFEAGSYDVVIAGIVLHAASDLARTLGYVRKLLKPGGKLIMAEIVNLDNVRDAFVFGLLPGWWMRPCGKGRDQGAMLTEEQWAELLPQCGFSGIDMLFRDHEEPPHHRMSIIVATATDENPLGVASSAPCYILRDRQSKTQEAVAIGLEDNLLSHSLAAKVISTSLETVNELELNLKGSTVISLLELDNSVLAKMNAEQFGGIKKMALDPQNLLWVNSGSGITVKNPDAEMAVGLARTICSERGEESFRTLILEHPTDTVGNVDTISRIVLRIMSYPGAWNESEFVQKDRIVYVPRVAPNRHLNEAMARKINPREFESYDVGQQVKPHVTVTIGTPGLLDTLFYAENLDGTRPLEKGDVEIEIKASSLNFKDLMHALGQIPGKAIGFDGAGVISRTAPGSSFSVGDRVMWCRSAGEAFGTFVRCSELQAQKIPDDMSFHVAAALPVVYHTVIYSLIDLGRLQKGESVLIHAGAGGVGQAAIQLAKILGAGEIFVTVGSHEKRELLKDLYGLPDNRILSSRDSSFQVDIKLATNGRGVDVVLNSLGGDLLQATWECVAPFGRFIEIGKGDILNNTALPMEPFTRNVSFIAVDVVVLHEQAKPLVKKLLEDFMALREKHPELHEPRPLHVFPASKIEDAMRFLQGGKNTGKTIIDFTTPGDQLQFRPALKPAYSFNDHATFVISGGLGGLGRNVIRWMAGRGAKYFLALSRKGAEGNPEALKFVAEIASMGAQVWAPACDTTDKAALKRVLDDCTQRYPPIKGCIQGAMVLRDTLFENMTGEMFQEALAPKAVGSWNLHELLPKDLDFFVLLSSVSGIVGQRGQSNYAAGNTFEDALSRHRVSAGLKAVSMNLPVLAEAGWAVENYSSVASTLLRHTLLTQDQLMALLDIICDPEYDCTAPGASQVLTIPDSPQTLGRMAEKGSVNWLGRPLFANLARMGQTTQGDDGGENHTSASVTVNYLELVKASTSVEEAGEVIAQGLLQKLAKALSVPPENLDVTKPAYVLGVDSLIAVEVRYWIVKNVGVEVAVFDILRDQSLASLCGMVAARVLGICN